MWKNEKEKLFTCEREHEYMDATSHGGEPQSQRHHLLPSVDRIENLEPKT
jgi:hypothetical protein